MQKMDNHSYLPIIQEDNEIVAHIFHYIRNYLFEHDEHDLLDMDFVVTIISFFNLYLVPILFGREERVLFKNLSQFSLSGSIQRLIDNVVNLHQLIKNDIVKLSSLEALYNNGYNSSIEEIHDNFHRLIKLFNKLTHLQSELYPIIDHFLKKGQKEKINRCLLEFNAIAIKEQLHHSILEKYQKYSPFPKEFLNSVLAEKSQNSTSLPRKKDV